jgi:hypothetical protein
MKYSKQEDGEDYIKPFIIFTLHLMLLVLLIPGGWLVDSCGK